MLTNEELKAIAEREQKATKGPWTAVFDTGAEIMIWEGDSHKSIGMDEDNSCNNEAFISCSRQDIPALLAHITEQQQAIEKLGTLVEDIRDQIAQDLNQIQGVGLSTGMWLILHNLRGARLAVERCTQALAETAAFAGEGEG